MLKKLKTMLKSKTINYAMLIAILGVFELNYRSIEHFVPEQYRGLVFILISVGIVVLRFQTTKPLSEK